MNLFHAAIRFNPGILSKLVEFVDDRLYLNDKQKHQLVNGQTTILKKSPLHIVAKYDRCNDCLE